MIGRLRENRAEVFGSRSAPGLRRFLSSQNTDSPVALNFTWETHRDSDHYSFFAQQIPYLMIFTGKHPDYHTPYDDVEKLNLEGMERITRLLFRAVYAAAQEPALPPFRSAAFREGAQAQAEAETPLPDPPARLGVTWDEGRAKQKVIQLTEIDPGSAAESAGLQVGDRMVEFDRARGHDPRRPAGGRPFRRRPDHRGRRTERAKVAAGANSPSTRRGGPDRHFLPGRRCRARLRHRQAGRIRFPRSAGRTARERPHPEGGPFNVWVS